MKGFLDIETGGFSVSKNGVCEIALIAVDKDNNFVDEFNVLIKPYTRADDTDELVSYKDDAMAVNGLTEQQLIEQGIDVVEAMNLFVEFCMKHNIQTIIGHCSNTFDIPRVEHLLQRFTQYSLDEYRKLDTIILAKDKIQLTSYKLIDLCTHFGIVNKNPHRASGDAFATFELYKSLINI